MENKEKVLAKVSNETITEADLDHMLKNMNPQMAQTFQGEEGRKTLLAELVNQKLFYLEAVENNIEENPQFQQEFAMLKENFITQFAIQSLINSAGVTHDELESYYNDNKASFIAPPKVSASHILVASEAEANDIKSRIDSGESFEALAKECSTCPSKERGGDLGSFGKGQMVPEFEDAAFGMEQGAVSAPVKTQFGYHIIKLNDKEDEKPLEFEEVRSNLLRTMMAERQHSLYQQHVSDLKEKYSVEIPENK